MLSDETERLFSPPMTPVNVIELWGLAMTALASPSILSSDVMVVFMIDLPAGRVEHLEYAFGSPGSLCLPLALSSSLW
jgi:hypothetical protein